MDFSEKARHSGSMSRLLSFSLFLSFAVTLVGSTHYYIWARLVRDVDLPAPWQQVGTLVIVALGVALPVAMVLSRLVSGWLVRALLGLAFGWMGVFFFILCLLVSVDVVRAAVWVALHLAPDLSPVDPA